MFQLVTMKQTVKIIPIKLEDNRDEAITEELNEQFANKVITNVGLCIALYDIVTTGNSMLHQGDACAHVHVTFRYIVFRPFMGETIVGTIRACSREGVHVSLGFFDNILIQPKFLPVPYRFDETEQLWVWEYIEQKDDGEEVRHDMLMEVGEKIRFKVTKEMFKDTSPAGPSGPETSVDDRLKKVPYSIIGSCVDSGLGLLSWWPDSD